MGVHTTPQCNCGHAIPAGFPYCPHCGSVVLGAPLLENKYQIVRLIQGDETQRVYLAKQYFGREGGGNLSLPRALKCIVLNTTHTRHVAREVGALVKVGQFNLDGVPGLTDFFVHSDPDNRFRACFFVSPFIEGQDFATWANGREWHDVVQAGFQLFQRVAAIHELTPPLIHGDIKPSNVIVDAAGKVWLIDFGAVPEWYMEPADEDAVYVARGTPPYMPFEQWDRRPGTAADVYSAGMTLFHALVGDEVYLVPERAQDGSVPRPGLEADDLDEDWPSVFREILLQATAARPEDRPTIQEVIDRLETLIRPIPSAEIRDHALEITETEPHALPAYIPLATISLYQDMPVDAGLLWGINRRPFVGLWGGDLDPLVASLRGVESVIRTTWRMYRRSEERYWIVHDLAQASQLPGTKEAYRNAFLPNDIGDFHGPIGIVLDGHSLGVQALIEIAHRLCRRFVRDWFSDRPVTVLISMSALQITAAGDSLSRLLKESLANLPLEALIQSRSLSRDNEITEGFPVNEPSRAETKTGAPLVAWMKRVEQNRARQSGRSWRPVPQTVAAVLQQFRGLPMDSSASMNALDLVRDFEKWLPGISHPAAFCREWLELVEEYVPELVPPLIFAFAQSQLTEIRRAALIHSGMPMPSLMDTTPWQPIVDRSDVLLEAFIAGAEHRLDINPDPVSEWGLEPDRQPFLLGLLLATIRRLARQPHNHATQCLRDKLLNWSTFAPDLRHLVDPLTTGLIADGPLLNAMGSRQSAIALRANIRFQFVEGQLTEMLSPWRPEPWWLLLGLPPSVEFLSELGRLPLQSRVVLGLVTQDEWQTLSLDPPYWESVTDCRRGLRLSVSS